MLLEKLQKYTWNDHPDHEDISLAVKKLMDTATIMNEKKRDAEGARKVFEISKNITGKVPVCSPRASYLTCFRCCSTHTGGSSGRDS